MAGTKRPEDAEGQAEHVVRADASQDDKRLPGRPVARERAGFSDELTPAFATALGADEPDVYSTMPPISVSRAAVGSGREPIQEAGTR